MYTRTHGVLRSLNEKRGAANAAPAVSALIATQDITADVYLSLCCFDPGHICISTAAKGPASVITLNKPVHMEGSRVASMCEGEAFV